LLALLVLFALLPGCGPESRPRRVVLITLDTLRLDAFDAGGGHSAMPLTRTWAEGARTFTRSYAASSVTQPTHATLLTARHPWQHGVSHNGKLLAANETTLPERLQEAGFRTAAVVASFPLHRVFGFAQGFDSFSDRFEQHFDGVRRWSGEDVPSSGFYSRADRVTERALAVLDDSRGDDEFLWFHYFDPHAPYGSSQPRSLTVGDVVRLTRSKPTAVPEVLAQVRALYDTDVRFLDQQLDRVLSRLRSDEETYETHVFVTSDHGESFGEQGVLAHGSRLSPEQIHIPLIVRSPGLPVGSDARLVGSLDVGEAMRRAALGEQPLFDPDPGAVYGMIERAPEALPERRTDGVRVAPFTRLFYAASGSQIVTGDAASVTGASPAEAEGVRVRFGEFSASLDGAEAPTVRDAKAREALRALGYLD
jgi:arylsulfatase A-like enzyme